MLHQILFTGYFQPSHFFIGYRLRSWWKKSRRSPGRVCILHRESALPSRASASMSLFFFPLGWRCELLGSRSFTPWCVQKVQGDSRHGGVEIPGCTGHFQAIWNCLVWLRGYCDLLNINVGVDLISLSPPTLPSGGNFISQGG